MFCYLSTMYIACKSIGKIAKLKDLVYEYESEQRFGLGIWICPFLKLKKVTKMNRVQSYRNRFF